MAESAQKTEGQKIQTKLRTRNLGIDCRLTTQHRCATVEEPITVLLSEWVEIVQQSRSGFTNAVPAGTR